MLKEHPVRSRALFASSLVVFAALVAPRDGRAQEPIVSMGQPSRWWPYAGASVTFTGLSGSTAVGGAGFLGIQHPLMNPITGGPTLAAEGYFGAAGDPVSGADGGLRAAMALPVLFTQFGIDWNLRIDRAQFFMSVIATSTAAVPSGKRPSLPSATAIFSFPTIRCCAADGACSFAFASNSCALFRNASASPRFPASTTT
jgi:hypothetical protein